MSLLHPALTAALALVVTTPGCAAILNGNNKTIFLHMSEADARATSFYLDGKPVQWRWKTYSRSETGRSGDTVFYRVTSLPALTVNSPARYLTRPPRPRTARGPRSCSSGTSCAATSSTCGWTG